MLERRRIYPIRKDFSPENSTKIFVELFVAKTSGKWYECRLAGRFRGYRGERKMRRREFLKLVGAGAALALCAPCAGAATPPPRVLWLRRQDEGARLDLEAERDYRHACWLLRDVRAGRSAWASPRLLRTAAWMQAFLAAYQVHRPFEVHSGFRTRFTNEACGGARASLHLLDGDGLFHAMDIRMEGVSSEYLGRLAALAKQGGVGFYTDRKTAFVHIDDGRVRYWRG